MAKTYQFDDGGGFWNCLQITERGDRHLEINATCDAGCIDYRDLPRRDYLEAVVTAYTAVAGHRNPARANACSGNATCSVDDVLTVGGKVITYG